MTDKQTAIADLSRNEKYVVIILDKVVKGKQKIRVHTHSNDDGELMLIEALKIMKADADTEVLKISGPSN